MKKTLVAISTAVLAFGAAAEGNNSVTLYGVADAYVGTKTERSLSASGTNVVSSRQRQTVVESGGLSTSRIGISVQEDLGNGKTAFANIEQGLNLDTGDSKGAARRAVVGLSTELGRFSAGRQATPYDDFIDSVDAQSDSAFSAVASSRYTAAQRVAELRCVHSRFACGTADLDAVNDSGLLNRTGAFFGYQSRYSNSLRYDSPNFDGFSGSVMLGLGENKAGNRKADVGTSLAMKYANGPLVVGLAVQEDQEGDAGLGLVPANARVKLRNTLLAGSYDFGMVRAHAGLNQAKYRVRDARGSWDAQKEYFIGAVVPMNAYTLVGQIANSKGDTFGKTTSIAGEVRYAMSKRTTVYGAANGTKIHRAPETTAAGSARLSNSSFGVGMRHTF